MARRIPVFPQEITPPLQESSEFWVLGFELSGLRPRETWGMVCLVDLVCFVCLVCLVGRTGKRKEQNKPKKPDEQERRTCC
jgi:hypothetical protein